WRRAAPTRRAPATSTWSAASWTGAFVHVGLEQLADAANPVVREHVRDGHAARGDRGEALDAARALEVGRRQPRCLADRPDSVREPDLGVGSEVAADDDHQVATTRGA